MKTGSLLVSIDRVKPNAWNPNKMPPEFYRKLKHGIQQTMKEAGKVPPIVVRPNKSMGCYEIIDGEHRWKVFRELKLEKIPVFSIEVDDKLARILTNTLNYLRGEPDSEKFSKNIMELIEMGSTPDDLIELLPMDESDLQTIIDAADVSIEAYKSMLESSGHGNGEVEKADLNDEESGWVDIKFHMSIAQAKIVESEIARIASTLRGKNARSRALELMAVNSSHTSLDEVR